MGRESAASKGTRVSVDRVKRIVASYNLGNSLGEISEWIGFDRRFILAILHTAQELGVRVNRLEEQKPSNMRVTIVNLADDPACPSLDEPGEPGWRDIKKSCAAHLEDLQAHHRPLKNRSS